MSERYHYDYPSRPIGGGNPYHCCIFCQRSAPDINGQIDRHESHCLYRQVMSNPSESVVEDLLDNYDDSHPHYYEICHLAANTLVDLGWKKDEAWQLVWGDG